MRLHLAIPAIALISVACTSPAVAVDDWWPTLQHDAGQSGASGADAPDTNEVRWMFNADLETPQTYTINSHSSPTVQYGNVYVGSGNDKVYCLKADTFWPWGRKLWEYTASWDVVSAPAISAADEIIYVTADKGGGGQLHAMNLSDLSKAWGPIDVDDFVWFASPVAVEGYVYFVDEDQVFKYDSAGNEQWSTGTPGPNPDMGFGPTGPAVSGDKLYIGGSDFKVHALNTSDGSEAFTYTTGGYIWAPPTVVGGTVYVGSWDNVFYALSAADLSFQWKYTTGGDIFSSAAVSGGIVYVGSMDEYLYALNASTGALVWSFDAGGPIFSSPAVADGKVCFGTQGNAMVYCLDAAGNGDQTTDVIWSYQAEGEIKSSPSIADGMLFIGDVTYEVIAFGPRGMFPLPALNVWGTLVLLGAILVAATGTLLGWRRRGAL